MSVSAGLKIAIAGAGGRMGRALLEAVSAAPDLTLHAALEAPGHPLLGKDAGELIGSPAGVPVGADIDAIAGADVLIDFTRPEGTAAHLSACRKHGVRMVIGTTGFSADERAEIAQAAREIAIVLAPNMSVGTNLVFKLIGAAARVLNEGYDIEIAEHMRSHIIALRDYVPDA